MSKSKSVFYGFNQFYLYQQLKIFNLFNAVLVKIQFYTTYNVIVLMNRHESFMFGLMITKILTQK